MSKKEHVSETPATAFLKKHGTAYTEHLYAYEEHDDVPFAVEG